MTPDLCDYARLVLRNEPTRSLPLAVLRERLRQAAGERLPGTVQLEQSLGADPSFRLLCPPPLIQAGTCGYTREALAAGFPQPEPRVLLVEERAPSEDRAGLFGDTGDSLLALLACERMRSDVAEAIAALEEIGKAVREPAVLKADGAERSTTPPPGLPRRAQAPRDARPSASRRPRLSGSR